MTNPDIINPASTEARDIIGIALAAAQPQPVEPGRIYLIAGADGQIHEHNYTGPEYTNTPDPIDRTVSFTDTASLLYYWGKYQTAASEAYATSPTRRSGRYDYTITAVLDAHLNPTTPGWCNHRATTRLDLSQPLLDWLTRNGQPLNQGAFGDFVEDNLPFIVNPPAADLLELTERFSATTTTTFKSGVRRHNGQTVLSYTEQVDGGIGEAKLAVPTTITLALPVWAADTETVEFTARLRYRLDRDQLTITYLLDRPDDIINAQFDQIVAAVADHIDRPVYRGTATI